MCVMISESKKLYLVALALMASRLAASQAVVQNVSHVSPASLDTLSAKSAADAS